MARRVDDDDDDVPPPADSVEKPPPWDCKAIAKQVQAVLDAVSEQSWADVIAVRKKPASGRRRSALRMAA